MIRCELEDINKIEISVNNYCVEMYFTDECGSISAVEISRNGAELLLTRLLESLNKLERRP